MEWLYTRRKLKLNANYLYIYHMQNILSIMNTFTIIHLLYLIN